MTLLSIFEINSKEEKENENKCLNIDLGSKTLLCRGVEKL